MPSYLASRAQEGGLWQRHGSADSSRRCHVAANAGAATTARRARGWLRTSRGPPAQGRSRPTGLEPTPQPIREGTPLTFPATAAPAPRGSSATPTSNCLAGKRGRRPIAPAALLWADARAWSPALVRRSPPPLHVTDLTRRLACWSSSGTSGETRPGYSRLCSSKRVRASRMSCSPVVSPISRRRSISARISARVCW